MRKALVGKQALFLFVVCHFLLCAKRKTEPKRKSASCRSEAKIYVSSGYISPKLFDTLFDDGIQLVHGIKTNMKNRLMSFHDKMMPRKRNIIGTINDLLKNKAQLVHSRHRPITNFLVNLVAVLGACCFFENKPEALQGYYIGNSKQLTLF